MKKVEQDILKLDFRSTFSILGASMAGRQDDEDVRTCGRVTGPRRRACAALARLRAAPAAAAGLKRAPEGLFHASRRAGTVQMHGAFAVFGQVVVITCGCGAAKQACRSRMMQRKRASACTSACLSQNASCKRCQGCLARTEGTLHGSKGARNALSHTVSRLDRWHMRLHGRLP